MKRLPGARIWIDPRQDSLPKDVLWEARWQLSNHGLQSDRAVAVIRSCSPFWLLRLLLRCCSHVSTRRGQERSISVRRQDVK